MNATETNPGRIARAIETECNDRWGVWLSDTGRWWATRNHSLPARALNAGCVPFLRADTPEELAEAIREQDEVEQYCPAQDISADTGSIRQGEGPL